MEDFMKMDTEARMTFVSSRYTVPCIHSKEDAYGKLIERIERGDAPPRIQIQSKRPIYYVAAAASIALILALFLTFYDFSIIQISAGTGEQEILELPDGSGVTLNALSEIQYSKKDFRKNRRLQLNGEAYFEVNEGDKFIVETTYGSIKVLGTSFNVHSREDYFMVSCISGKVFVKIGDDSDTISRGEVVSSINHVYRKTSDVDIVKALAWRNGEFYYESTELRFVLDEIERQFDVSITSSGIENRRFTGSFHLGNLEEALQIVCIPLDLDFEIFKAGKVKISP